MSIAGGWEKLRRWVRDRVRLKTDYEALAGEMAKVCARSIDAETELKLARGNLATMQEAVKHREVRIANLEHALMRREKEIEALFRDVPGLTPGEMERLAILAEECGEVVQAVGKILRFGWESQSPYGGRPNRANLEREIGSLRAIVNLMTDSDDLRLRELQSWQRTKRAGYVKWTLYQECSMSREEQLAMVRAIAANGGN